MARSPTTPHDYAAAIDQLAATARHGTGAGEAAARVLLSAYGPVERGFSAADIAGLEPADREAALTVLQGYAELGAPQGFVEAGDGDPARLFRELWHLWRGPEQEGAS